ncbi:hypothetical protein [Streptomyces sp. NPDC051098]|uniref:hypothetical protein n=1 Tax=Streptomyces sp. NPDC051098 TaxID=3155411 RepID=UPI003428F685
MRLGSPPRGGVVLCTCALLAATAACAGGSAAPGGGPSPSPSPRTTSPQELCEKLITHWSRVVLDGGDRAELDYQAMGLSGGQNEILLAVVAAARTEQRSRGPSAASALIDRQARSRCTERYRGGSPTGGPWQ